MRHDHRNTTPTVYRPSALDRLRSELDQALQRRDAIEAFSAAGEAEPIFTTFSTPHEAIRDVLTAALENNYREGAKVDALLQSIIRQYRLTKRSLWSSMLLFAFHPMLCRLSARLRGASLTADERQSVAVNAFLSTVTSLRRFETVPKLPCRLRFGSTNAAITELSRSDTNDRRQSAAVEDAKARGLVEPFRGARAQEGRSPERQSVELAGLGQLTAEELAPVDAGLNGVKGLRELVRALHPSLSEAEQSQMCRRVKRTRARAKARGEAPMSGAALWAMLNREDVH